MDPTRGILGWGTYVPYGRLDRSTIAAVAGAGGGVGTRTVASYDEDTTTMGAEAARFALAVGPSDIDLDTLWFVTTEPAYLDKTNATAVHAASGLDPGTAAFDMVGAVRSAAGAWRAALAGDGQSLVVVSDRRSGLPGSADEAAGGDAAAAFLIGGGTAPVLATCLATASRTEEFLDRWRSPGDRRSKRWEERFGASRYEELGRVVWQQLLRHADVEPSAIDRVVVVGTHDRAVDALRRSIVQATSAIAVDHGPVIGNAGAAQGALALAAVLESAEPGELICVVSLADGADAQLLRTTEHIADHRAFRTVAAQLDAGGPVSYGKYLTWRDMLEVEPPRRPDPQRPSASAAGRATPWKFAFVGSESESGDIHLPPAPADTRSRAMASATGTIATFTIDRIAYSPSPPVVFAIVDFDGGGRVPVELTDVEPDDISIGMRVEMTFRRLFTADGIHNYFWKARPARLAGSGTEEQP